MGVARAYRDEQIRHQLLILRPTLPILLLTPLNISICTVHNHTRKEERVKPWEWATEPRDQTPSQGKIQIARIVNLAGVSIPSIDQNAVPRFRLDRARVLDSLPGQLGEGFAWHESSAFLRAETVLLRVGGVPNPVHKEIGGEEGDEEVGGPAVGRWGMVGEVEGAVAVRKGNASQVPEDEHKAPFFVVHVPVQLLAMPSRSWGGAGGVPGCGNAFFALGTCICVQEVGHDQKAYLWRYVSESLVLSGGSGA